MYTSTITIIITIASVTTLHVSLQLVLWFQIFIQIYQLSMFRLQHASGTPYEDQQRKRNMEYHYNMKETELYMNVNECVKQNLMCMIELKCHFDEE